MSPTALLELEEKAQDLIHLEAVHELVDGIYALDVSKWTDEDFATVEAIIDRAIALLSTMPIAQHRPSIEKLLQAREGVEQGLSPDPAKRPSDDEMRAFVSAHLH